MTSKCSICLEKSSGCHFGAEACRACAAFFRRSITQNKKYQCQGNGDCDITNNIRCMCRACRFTKCLKMGMNPVGVLQKPECSRKWKNSNPTTSASEFSLDDLPLTLRSQVPILTKMRENYQKLLNARQVVYKKDGQNLFEEKVPRAINYLESIEQAMKDVGMVADWISWCFEDFVKLEKEQKNILFRNFYTKFCQLEITFTSHIKNTPTRIQFQSGDYLDMNDLEKFYHDPRRATQMSREEIEKIYKPYFALQQRGLILPMISLKLDHFEYFTLITLILWNIGLENLSAETIEIAEKVKDQVTKELIFYMKNYKKIEEPGLRIARIVNLLPAVEMCVKKFQEDVEISQLFSYFESPKEFYNLVNGQFC